MNNIIESKHPLIKHLVNEIRSTSIPPALFRKNIALVAQLLLFEALQKEKMELREITTWIGKERFAFLDQKKFVFIPILRAGLPMLDGVLEVLSEVPSGFLAMKRDEKSFKPILFYKRFPSIEDKHVILLDPMVATGGSLSDAIEVVKEERPASITSLNIIGAPDGLRQIGSLHPDVTVHIAQIDDHLNAQKFIIPGLGDAGDRAFNT